MFTFDMQALQALHRAGADLQRTDSGGDTPAHKAARFNRVECLEFLQQCGVDMHIPNADDQTVEDLANDAV
jgi:ankyrin repeat protein